MNNSSNDTARGQAAPAPRIARISPQPAPARPWNSWRDAIGAVLLLGALLVPWNLYFGITIFHSSRVVWALLIMATALSLGSIAVTLSGRRRGAGLHPSPTRASGLRLALNTPYAVLVIGFMGFDAVQSARLGGTVNLPGGVGPGAWLGLAGALLCAQPVLTGTAEDDTRFARWHVAARAWGYTATVGASISFVFNLAWRVHYALTGPTGSISVDKQSGAVIVTALVYGLAALAAVVVACSAILRSREASRLVTIALGGSTLIAGVLVWILPIGRELDAFHGIAQNTSTAGVGWEGYAAWVAAAAIFAPSTLRRLASKRPIDTSVVAHAAQEGLLVIVVWCFGSAVMRLTDLAVGVSLNLPYSRYDSMTLAAFDFSTAVLGFWLRVNLGNRALSARLVCALGGTLFVLAISRVAVGIALAPRFADSTRAAGPVYGNNLAQQITSTFDVVLCGLAFCILGLLIWSRGRGRHDHRRIYSSAAGSGTPDSHC